MRGPHFFGPYRRPLADGRVEFLGYERTVEWRGFPRDGVVFPDDYEMSAEWWWKFTPLSVQLRAFVESCQMSLDAAAAACAVPTSVAVDLLGLSPRRAQPLRVQRVCEPVGNSSIARVPRGT